MWIQMPGVGTICVQTIRKSCAGLPVPCVAGDAATLFCRTGAIANGTQAKQAKTTCLQQKFQRRRRISDIVLLKYSK